MFQQQQQQLYADAEEALPPADEVENDRQQRVYRGQPSTVGQVQRDRDGLRHSNAIQVSNMRLNCKQSAYNWVSISLTLSALHHLRCAGELICI